MTAIFILNGSILADPVNITISDTEGLPADVSFNPDQWDPAWATGNSPPITAKISNITGYGVGNVDFSSIRLNGAVSIITGSNKIIDDDLYVQFERALDSEPW